MDKRTILAIVLSVLIITTFMILQQMLFPQEATVEETSVIEQTEEKPDVPEETSINIAIRTESKNSPEAIKPILLEEEKTITTNYFEFLFSTKGGAVKSIKLLQYKETDGTPVEMILTGETKMYPFNIMLGDYNTANDYFEYSRSMDDEYIFSRDYYYDETELNEDNEEVTVEKSFTVKKIYQIKDNEYLVGFQFQIESEAELPFKTYILEYGPQTGPEYEELNQSLAFRKLIYLVDGNREDITSKVSDAENKQMLVEKRLDWAGIEGKYFVTIGISHETELTEMETGFIVKDLEGLKDRASIYFKRILIKNSVDDKFKFYIGPKKESFLKLYNSKDDNAFGEAGRNLNKAVKSEFWGWLADILRIPMEFFYSFTGNWGIAIILLTILIKVLFFPITRKSFESTSKMQALGPRLEELKVKYKNNPQKLNQEMAALYKKEGVSPLGGCLPLLMQLPIFLSLYLLFSTYFDFRGAAFISPWITDLSAPESILSLPFEIPFLGNQLRLLPFIMVGITFLQQFMTQPQGQSGSQNQTKMIMMLMPLVFFFIMYNLPSGLLIYWTMQSVLTFGQMFYINKIKKTKTT